MKPLDLSAAYDAAASGAASSEPVIEPQSLPTDTVAAAQPTEHVSAEPVTQPTTAAQPQAPASQPAAAQPSQPWTLRTALQGAGFAGDFSDDQSAFQALTQSLVQRNQEYEQALQIAQWHRANQDRIQAAMAAYEKQQQPAASQQPAAPAVNAWQVPDWNPQFEQFLRSDKEGNITVVPGADPSLPMKYQQYRQWQTDTVRKIITDPAGTLAPVLKPMIEEQAKALIQQHLGQYDDRQFASQFVSSSADWMYQKGQNGQRAHDALGQPLLSPAGQRFAENVKYLESIGIKDVRQQQALAERLTRGDSLEVWASRQNSGGQQTITNTQPAPAAQPATPEQVNDALKKKALAAGGKGANRLPASGAQGGAGPAGGAGDPQHTDPRLGLGGRLSKAFREAQLS